MKRRTILKRLAILTSGLVVTPSCNPVTEEKILEAYDQLKVSEIDHAFLANICEAIIPSDVKIKGAKELGIENFVLVMVNDCLENKNQQRFMKGWDDFKNYLRGQGKGDPITVNPRDLESSIVGVLKSIENKGKSEDASMMGMVYFLETAKQFTILGYSTSEYYMTAIMPYKMVPGKFNGKIEIGEQDKVNLYG